MRVFEHCDACPAPYGGGTVTRSMRRVAHPMLYRVLFSGGGGAGARVITLPTPLKRRDSLVTLHQGVKPNVIYRIRYTGVW